MGAPLTRLLRRLVPPQNRPYLTDREVRVAYLWVPVAWLALWAVMVLAGVPNGWREGWPWAAWAAGFLISSTGCGIYLHRCARQRMCRERIDQ